MCSVPIRAEPEVDVEERLQDGAHDPVDDGVDAAFAGELVRVFHFMDARVPNPWTGLVTHGTRGKGRMGGQTRAVAA